MILGIGTSVRVKSRCSLDGRTGIITELPAAWPEWARVELDPVEGKASWGILPFHELRSISPSERPAIQVQASLFGGVP